MLFSQLKRLKVMLLHLLVLCSAQLSAQPETHQMKGIVGKFLTFPVMVLKSGSLLYGDLGNIAQVFPGKQSNTNLEKRFKNRLHWNNVTGFFTLSDLRIEDSGVYTLENTDEDGEKMTHTFNLTVYYGEERTQDFLIIPVICVLIVLVLVGVAIYLKKRRNEPSQDSPGRKQDDILYAEITHIKPADNQEERTGLQGLDPLRDNSNLTSVYDTVQLHHMAASEDVNTS